MNNKKLYFLFLSIFLMTFSVFSQTKRALENQKIKAEEQAELERIEQAKVSDESKKIYLIAGAVAVLGAVIIIIKTRKK